MQISNLRVRAVTIGAIVVAIVVGVIWFARRPAPREVSSVAATRVGSAGKPNVTSTTASIAGTLDSTSGGPRAPSESDPIGSAGAYPVNLEALRARLPNNRYWTLGAPTSDPAIAKARAARAEQDNVVFGRIQSNEATPDEIRAYYAERRAISLDYLHLAELVLAEQGEALPPRDRGMFELSVNLHRARLQQIERDQSDALARRGTR